MTTAALISLCAIFVLLILSAFFSGSETALTAASRAHIHQLVKRGNHRAGIVQRLLSERDRLIGAILLGNNLVNILASALATSILIGWDSGFHYYIILVVPVVMPLVTAVGIDPVHFGLVVTLNLGIGQQTPPVASVLITACSIAKANIWEVSKVNVYFISVLFAILIMVTYLPAIPMSLVELFYR